MVIKISDSISIQKPLEEVFTFVSNLENDKVWRKEINHTVMKSRPQLNARASENSFLSKRVPNHILELQCIEFEESKKVVYETVFGSKFYLKSEREVEAVSSNETKFIYTLEFDTSVVKHGLGFSLPTFLVKLVAKADMKKYLNQLRIKMDF